MSTEASPLADGRSLHALRGVGFRSDEALCAIAARGDRGAFGAVYERHHQALYRYCHSILGHHEDAFDAVHNAMLKAWEALLDGGPNAPLRPWLFRIAHNEAVTVLRRRRPHRPLDDVDTAAPRPVEETLDTRERLDRLRADLEAMPERQRSALLLRELCGLRHDEIAMVLGVSPATARQTIYEARVALHEAEAGRELACAVVRHTLSDGDGRVRRARRIRSHLRTCPACASFAGSVRRRPGQLAALTPPLPGAAVVGLLARLAWTPGPSGVGVRAAGGTMTVAGAGSAVSHIASVMATTVAVGTVAAAGIGGVIAIKHAVTRPTAKATAVAPTDRRGGSGLALEPSAVASTPARQRLAPSGPPPFAGAGAPAGPAPSAGASAPGTNAPAATTVGLPAGRNAADLAAASAPPTPVASGSAATLVASATPAPEPVADTPSTTSAIGRPPRPWPAAPGGSTASPAPGPGSRPPADRAPQPPPTAARPETALPAPPAPNEPKALPIGARTQPPAAAIAAGPGVPPIAPRANVAPDAPPAPHGLTPPRNTASPPATPAARSGERSTPRPPAPASGASGHPRPGDPPGGSGAPSPDVGAGTPASNPGGHPAGSAGQPSPPPAPATGASAVAPPSPDKAAARPSADAAAASAGRSSARSAPGPPPAA